MIINQNGQPITKIEYKNEDELQKVIFSYPELLNYTNKLISIGREVKTEAGPVDVLIISDKGDIIVVEAKLGRNRQSRREVVAQIMDYISSMSQYSYHELDEYSDNQLSLIVDKQTQTQDSVIDLPKTIDNNLRHGKVHLVLAVDEANDDLRRIVQFLADHSDFNLALVEISQHKNEKDEIFYSSNTIIESRDRDFRDESKNDALEQAFSSWNQTHPEFPAFGSARTFRQIRPQNWPAEVHYEFYSRPSSETFDIRLDNEFNLRDPRSSLITKTLIKFEDVELPDGYNIIVDKNSKEDKVLRIRVRIKSSDVEKAPKIMAELIRMTKNEIDKLNLKTKTSQ